MAYDLEKDLSLFTSTHADQCTVYRQMRSFLLRGDRKWLAPEAHDTPYAEGVLGPLSWTEYVPYTNVLWLAYIYEYITAHFSGDEKDLRKFKRDTRELWTHLNPNAKLSTPSFGCAADVVQFAAEAGWLSEEQLMGRDGSILIAEREDSIILSQDTEFESAEDGASRTRRSPRRRQQSGST
jgi:serine/threonine-protein kinase haspin